MELIEFVKQKLSIKIILSIAVVLVLFLIIRHEKSIEVKYKTQAIETGDITQTVSANGTLNPVVIVSVGTQVSGTVKKLYADFNDHVKQDQLLVELDPALLQAQANQSQASVASAQASLDLAQANEARASGLYKNKFISKQDMDQSTQLLKSARAQLALTQAQAEKDKTNLSYAMIRSPVSGVVIDRRIDVGQTVAASFQTPTLFEIAQDLSKMQIDTSFAEADVGNIKEGQSAQFTVDAFPNKSFKGVVKQIRLNPTTLQNVVTYDVVVTVDNPDQLLMPGMTAYVNITTAQHNNVRLIPNAALRYKPKEEASTTQSYQKHNSTKDHKDIVYVLTHGELTPISIKTGIADKQFTELLSNEITTNDSVVIEEVMPKDDANSSSSNFKMRLF